MKKLQVQIKRAKYSGIRGFFSISGCGFKTIFTNQAHQPELTSEPEPEPTSSTSSCGGDITEEFVGEDEAE